MDLCFSLKCTKSSNDDEIYKIPSYITDNHILSVHTSNFEELVELKNSGNKSYKEYKFNNAIHSYTKALTHFCVENNAKIYNRINLDESLDVPTMPCNATLNEIDQSVVVTKLKLDKNSRQNNQSQLVERNRSYPAQCQSSITKIKDESNSSSPQSPLFNPKSDFINKIDNHKNNTKKDHPKIKSIDVMILYTTLLANRSASFIRIKEYEKANKDAEKIIDIRPNWIKGYYRKAEALKGLTKYLESLDYYHQALKFNPSSEKILNSISSIEIILRNDELGIKIHQLVPGYDICIKKSIFKPIQYIVFNYALQMQNYIYIIADKKSNKCILVDACWDIDGILEYVSKEKLKIVGAIYTHFHIDHTGGIPPPPYNKYFIKVDGIVKLSKALPNIPFFMAKDDIEPMIKQNPEFNRKRLVPIRDRQCIYLNELEKLCMNKKTNKKVNIQNKTKNKNLNNELRLEKKIDRNPRKNNSNETLISTPIASTPTTSTPKNVNAIIKNKKIISNNDNALMNFGEESEVNYLASINDVSSIKNNMEYESDNNDNNVIDGSNIANIENISNISYENSNSKIMGNEDSIKSYSNLEENYTYPTDIQLIKSKEILWTSTLERKKGGKVNEETNNKNCPFIFTDMNKFGKLSDTFSTISIINPDRKDISNIANNSAISNVSNQPKIDDFRIQFIFTPGHTKGSMCILVNDERLFSGDTLLIGTCGRVDLPESSKKSMYNSLMNVLSKLDDDIVVYPGHSYGGDEWTTIAQEKLFGSMYDYGSYEAWLYEMVGCDRSDYNYNLYDRNDDDKKRRKKYENSHEPNKNNYNDNNNNNNNNGNGNGNHGNKSRSKNDHQEIRPNGSGNGQENNNNGSANRGDNYFKNYEFININNNFSNLDSNLNSLMNSNTKMQSSPIQQQQKLPTLQKSLHQKPSNIIVRPDNMYYSLNSITKISYTSTTTITTTTSTNSNNDILKGINIDSNSSSLSSPTCPNCVISKIKKNGDEEYSDIDDSSTNSLNNNQGVTTQQEVNKSKRKLNKDVNMAMEVRNINSKHSNKEEILNNNPVVYNNNTSNINNINNNIQSHHYQQHYSSKNKTNQGLIKNLTKI